jgi:hypothetical protein
MYWKDELDAIYQKNQFGINLWYKLVGNQVELLLKSNKRIVGSVIQILDTEEGLKIEFKASGTDNENQENTVFSTKEIKYIDPYLK